MNEYDSLLISEMNICRGCLKNGQDVYKVDNTVLMQYNKLITQSQESDKDVYLCIYCKYLIFKITKFIDHCHLVDKYLNSTCDMQHISANNTIVKPYVLAQTAIQTHSYCPDLDINSSLKIEPWLEEDCIDDMSDDMPLMMLKNNEEEESFVDAIKSESSDSTSRVKTKKNKRKKKFKNKEMDELRELVDIKTEKSILNLENYPKNKHKKPPREGFTSRMVQETAEYIVIRLTKDQVLEEMLQKSRTEKYIGSPFKCEKCIKGFNFDDVLRKHMEKHSAKNGPLKCEICSQYCPSAISLRGHMKSHSTRYQCKVCGEIRLARQHLLEHHNTSHSLQAVAYKCNTCDYSTYKRTCMQRHKKTHKASGDHTCEQCGNVFRNIDSLRVHMLRHDTAPRFCCPDCGRRFLYPSLLRLHRASGHQHYCVECDLNFKTRENLRRHFKKSKAHLDPSMLIYQCPSCEKRFLSQSSLTSHLSSNHGVKKEYVCGECGRQYSSGDALRAHGRRAHRGVTGVRHVCHVCQKSFTQRAVLVKHLRVHTGERPYSCTVCGLTFAQSATMRTHTRLVHQKIPRTIKKEREMKNSVLSEVLVQS